ncbi:MAG: Fic family protein [Ignavibacteria bacterium]|nr:Fic family protein [Ignavibacteria bacterium]
MQKFRLDWNYHSNNLEGNSLTFGETKALILFGITAQGKPLKDHFEITGHDKAIKWVLDVVKGEYPLTETFIRELHTLLLKEPYEVDAITPDGLPTKRWIQVGQYKSVPNHVLTKTGEIFRFASVEETPSLMHDLIEWYRSESLKPDVNPVLLAAEFHYRFIRIHPFDDGNGRMARILMNFILIHFGYPPLIIKTDDKLNYFSALQQADAGMIEPFFEYITKNLTRSLEIMISGAKGESIEEEDDLDKEIALLKTKLSFKPNGKENQIVKNEAIIREIYKRDISKLWNHFTKYINQFSDFYLQTKFTMSGPGGGWEGPEAFLQVEKYIPDETSHFYFQATFAGLKFNIEKKINYDIFIEINFDIINDYHLKIGAINKLFSFKYNKEIKESETIEIFKILSQAHKKFIEKEAENSF